MTGRPVVLRAAEVLFTAVVITGLSALPVLECIDLLDEVAAVQQ